MNFWISLMVSLFLPLSLPSSGLAQPQQLPTPTLSHHNLQQQLTRNGAIDPAAYRFAKPALRVRQANGALPTRDSFLFIQGSAGTRRIALDEVGVAVWPMESTLTRQYTHVGSVPESLQAEIIIRVEAPVAQRIAGATVRSMEAEYSKLIRELGMFARLRAPTPRNLLVRAAAGTQVRLQQVGKGDQERRVPASGLLRIPLHDARQANVISFSATPRAILLDLGVE